MTTRSDRPDVANPDSGDHGLRANSVGVASLTGQTVAQLGPIASVAVLVGFVAVSAGNGSWLTWILATVTVLLIGVVLSTLTRRSASSGGLATLLGREAGTFPALATGLAITIFGLGLAPFLGQVFGVYTRDYLQLVGVIDDPNGTDWIVILAAMGGFLLSGYLCQRDVRLSTQFLLVVELVSVVCLAVLLVAAAIKAHGSLIDHDQLSLHGVSLHGIVLGLVLAMFTFVTFEGVITFSEEATVPKKTVATAMYGAVAITGGIMVIASSIMTTSFRHAGSDVAKSANPLSDLADIAGVRWLSYVLQLGIVIGMLAGGLALTNWLSRLLYTLGREGVLPRSLGEAHPQHQTPWKATRVIVAFEILVFAVLTLLGKASDLTLYSYVGSYFTLLYIFVYGVALVAVAYVAWRRWGATRTALLAVIPTAVLVLVVYNSVQPEPLPPLNYYTDASLVTMVVISAVAWVGSRRKAGRLASLGSTSIDLL